MRFLNDKNTHILFYILPIFLLISGCANGQKTEQSRKIEEEAMNRKPILAGSWYPGNSEELRRMISGFMAQANVEKLDGRIVGLISPHAGYVYSGPVAAFAYKPLMLDKERYKNSTVIIIGPNHRTPGFSGISIWADGSWSTPLGATKIDKALADSLMHELGPVASFERRIHESEHSLEIQLPFLQYALGEDFKIVPIVFGMQSLSASRKLAEALAKHAKRKDIILLASTDLSHYHPEKKAHQLDSIFIDAVLRWDSSLLNLTIENGSCEGCGFGAVITVMEASKPFGADKVVKLRYATSGDVPMGSRSEVVGYFSAAFLETSNESGGVSKEKEEGYSLTDDEKKQLLKIARTSIEKYVKNGETYEPPAPKEGKLRENGAVFVTLHQNGMLRGCIGQMVAQQPLYLCVRDMAISSAVHDRRFTPVKPAELEKIDIEISVLSPMTKIDDWRNIKIGHHGVWLQRGMRSGVFLPQVGKETGWTLEYFLEELCSQKAGLPRDCYKDKETELFIFTVLEFDEKHLGLK